MSRFLPLCLPLLLLSCGAAPLPPVASAGQGVEEAPVVVVATGGDARVWPVGPPPAGEVARLRLSSKYRKYLGVPVVGGGAFPIVASAAVTDDALREAAYLIQKMVAHRPALLQPLVAAGIRYVVMAPSEFTTDVPEHADLTPKSYWDRRARGVGATVARPAVSGGEENLLDGPGDPYAEENILTHEFSHALEEFSLSTDPVFSARLEAAFAAAKAGHLWDRTYPSPGEPQVYAMENVHEYWAEATQSWFDANRVDDNQHGPLNTRERVRAKDPAVAALLTEVFGDAPCQERRERTCPWRYQKPRARPPAEVAHLLHHGEPVGVAPFVALPPAEGPATETPLVSVGQLPAVSPASGASVNLLIFNRRSRPIDLEWVNFSGGRTKYGTIAAGGAFPQQTYAGHVWVLREDGRDLVGFTASSLASQVISVR